MSGLFLLIGGGGGVALRSESDSDGAEGTIINTNKHHSGPSDKFLTASFGFHTLHFHNSSSYRNANTVLSQT